MQLPKVEKSRLVDQVVEIMYDKISRGDIKPGEKLPSETDLSEQLGVGRPTIREAMSRLLGLGLIVRGGYTMSVAEDANASIHAKLVPMLLEQWETRELYEARTLIESDLAILASKKATPEDIAELRAINELLLKNEKEESYWSLDMQFHEKIAAIAANEVMISISNIINDLFKRFEAEVEELETVKVVTYRDHEMWIDAIENGDEDAVRSIVKRALAGSENALYERSKAERK